MPRPVLTQLEGAGFINSQAIVAQAVTSVELADSAVTPAKVVPNSLTDAQMSVPNKLNAAWADLPKAAGVSNVGGWVQLRYRKVGNQVTVFGAWTGLGAGNVVGTLPAGFRPAGNVADRGKSVQTTVASTGVITALIEAADPPYSINVTFEAVS